VKYVRQSIAVILLFFSLGVIAETKLSVDSINKMLNNIKKSVQQKDADKFATYFTTGAKVRFEMPFSMGGNMNVNISQYVRMLKQGWALPVKYSYEVRDIQIKISQDKKSATVTDLTIESAEMDGKIIATTKTRETVEVIISNGVPKIRSLYGVVKL